MTTNPCADVESCANCERRTPVAIVSVGCVHEHVFLNMPACVRCHGLLKTGITWCTRCRRKGCQGCPMRLITEKMIIGHECARPKIQKFCEGRADAPLSCEVPSPMRAP